MIHDTVHSKVWVGTLDKCLYIIDIQTRSFDKRLDAHNEIVVCIAQSNDQKYMLN